MTVWNLSSTYPVPKALKSCMYTIMYSYMISVFTNVDIREGMGEMRGRTIKGQTDDKTPNIICQHTLIHIYI